MDRLLVWGAGKIGGGVAVQWKGDAIGYTRTRTRHTFLEEGGVVPICGNPLQEMIADDLLLFSISGHKAQYEAVQQAIASGTKPKRAVLISSTGAFGEATGILSATSAVGTTDRAQAIAQLETTFLEWMGADGVVIRFGGLYSAERGPYHAFLRKRVYPQGRPMNRPLGLIHDADAITATWNALRHPAPEPIYVGVVNPSPLRHQFYREANIQAKTMLSEIPFSEKSNIFYQTDTFQRDLLINPEFPDWRAIFIL